MSALDRLGLSALHGLDPERAHGLALKALNRGLAGRRPPVTSARLKTTLAGLHLPNPVGIAAGFDKTAAAVDATLALGVGFCEIGAVTPLPQPGNPRPRLFRLDAHRAAINRFGFNSPGMIAVHRNLCRHRRAGIVGINLGANKDSADKAADYIAVLARFHRDVDFATVNVSSPNTERLRDLQGREALDALLVRVIEARDALGPLPVFLKIAPDLEPREIAEIAETAETRGVDGIIATNTTLARPGIDGPHRDEAGGLSGAPLRERAQEVMRVLARETGGRVPLIGAGGIASAEDAYARIRAGAHAVQLYTALIYHGPGLAARIATGLDALLARDGIPRVADAVGVDVTG